jgi:starvation-inducible DNA-binding protein
MRRLLSGRRTFDQRRLRRAKVVVAVKERSIMSNATKLKPMKAEEGSDLSEQAVLEICAALRPLLADVFSLYLKTKNFHWHMRGSHFRDYHLLLDEQATQIYEIADEIAERARKLGGTTLRSIGDIARNQRLRDNDAENVPAEKMLQELRDDNERFVRYLRDAHEVCEKNNDVATTSLIEVWIDEAERRAWFLRETVA